MADDQFAPRLNIIETSWSVFRQAHEGSEASAARARQDLVTRYSPAIRNFVRMMTGDAERADDLAQEFVVRLLKGDFAGADPTKGRLRDLLCVSVRNMVRNHWSREKRRQASPLDEAMHDHGGEEETKVDPWLKSWRNNVLDIAWSALEDYQQQHPGSVAYTVLKIRSDKPDLDSPALAQALSEAAGRNFKPDTTRQQLRRARLRFAEFVVEEVANGLDSPDPDRIQEELICLGLYAHIRDVLPERWRGEEGTTT